MSRQTDEDLASSWHELMARYQRLVCRLDRELSAQHDVSSSEFEVLQQLQHAGPEGVRMADLAETAHLSQSALSRLVSRLEKDGYVVRSMCTDDRRSVFTTITPAGAAKFTEARPTQRAILREESNTCADAAVGLLLPRP